MGGFRFCNYCNLIHDATKFLSILIPPFTLSWKKEINIILYVVGMLVLIITYIIYNT